jgi:hypothetical protein
LREIAKATFPLWKGRGIDLINWWFVNLGERHTVFVDIVLKAFILNVEKMLRWWLRTSLFRRSCGSGLPVTERSLGVLAVLGIRLDVSSVLVS